MSVPLLEALADAIYRFEGDGPGMRANRNRNPGNLRPTSADQAHDSDNYRVFPGFVAGYNALLHDLASKVLGLDSHGLSLKSSLLEFFSVYAPSADGNRPPTYTKFVCAWLNTVYDTNLITPGSTFEQLYRIAQQGVPSGVPPA